eukprot:TRINITY_DN5422_c0_g1_i1.p1 TRINITY_DN5422_c0_g1~~TRINITY_DN5422_c0_g1_i1.p1  ORF type:complete len:553 (-),score=173.97 TRINITY_DN5422_c0_g1_i1:11-1669(-)
MATDEPSRHGRKLHMGAFPQLLSRDSPEAKYWRSFKYPMMMKLPSAVSDVSFARSAPHNFVVCSGTQVEVYDKQENEPIRSLGVFKEPSRCATYRADGRMIAVGCDDESIHVFNANAKGMLRKITGHKGLVRSVRFHPCNTRLLSCSHDHTVKVWDVPTGECETTLKKHQDNVRTLEVNPASEHIWFSGGYDHTIFGWDVRSPDPIISIDHGAPVESLVVFPTGTAIAAGGGSELKVWDILGGGKLLQDLNNHQKSITTVRFDGTNSRILTGSLDHHVKVYETEQYEVVHSIRYPAPILSMAISPDNTHLVVGMSEGTMSVRKRVVPVGEVEQNLQKSRRLFGGTLKHRIRGQNRKPSESDFVVHVNPRVRLQKYEKMLNKFQYADALDAVLSTRDPAIVVSMLQELQHRNALVSAVEGRNASTLEPLLLFIINYVNSPKFCQHVHIAADVVLDLYAEVIGQSEEIDELFAKLHVKLQREAGLQKRLVQVQGMLEMLVNSSNVAAALSHSASAREEEEEADGVDVGSLSDASVESIDFDEGVEMDAEEGEDP